MRFWKYEANGNDFILVTLSAGAVPPDGYVSQVPYWCHRRLGIGADGVLFFFREERIDSDFSISYYNADGSRAFCANGMRASLCHMRRLGVHKEVYTFTVIGGTSLLGSCRKDASYSAVRLPTVSFVNVMGSGCFVEVGCPHYVQRVADVSSYAVEAEGKKIRHDTQRFPQGVNVNFWQVAGERLRLRSYERGVEAETLSCGTGVVAAALSCHHTTGLLASQVETRGGTLHVDFTCKARGVYEDIQVGGSVHCLYEGKVLLHARSVRDFFALG